MRHFIILTAAAVIAIAAAGSASAHGSEPHPKCKKGYIVNDDHKCVKAPG